jgi:hypothetical protein
MSPLVELNCRNRAYEENAFKPNLTQINKSVKDVIKMALGEIAAVNFLTLRELYESNITYSLPDYYLYERGKITSEEINDILKTLRNLGYDPSDYLVERKTFDAINAFQSDIGVRMTSVVTPELKAILKIISSTYALYFLQDG